MGSDFNIKIPKDQAKVNVNDPGEFIWWSNHLGINLEQLLSIIDQVGNAASAVRQTIHARHVKAPVNGNPVP
jgi:hypothetical protein